MAPSIDHLFDRGFIGFENNGRLIISPVAHRPSLQCMGVDTERVVNVGGFSARQRNFLDFHRNSVFLESLRVDADADLTQSADFLGPSAMTLYPVLGWG